MSRAYDIVVASVITIIAVVIHVVSLELFAKGTPLHELAAGATHFSAADKAALWADMLIIWVPLLAVGGIWAWVFIREYRRQAATAVQQMARRP
jgi:hypothetical protein